MKPSRGRTVHRLLVAGALMIGIARSASGQKIGIVPTPVPGKNIQIVPTSTPTPRPPMNAAIGLDTLCAIVGCDEVNHPQIIEVDGAVKPELRITVIGSGFGGEPGRLILKGVGSGPIELTGLTWTPTAVVGTVPKVYDVIDSPNATVQVVNSWQRGSNEWKTGFLAARCGVLITRAGVRVRECSSSVTHWNCNGHSDGNFYNPDEAGKYPIVGRHRDVVTVGDSFRDPNRTYHGTDVYALEVQRIRYHEIVPAEGYDKMITNVRNSAPGNFTIDWTMWPGQDSAYVALVYADVACRSGQ